MKCEKCSDYKVKTLYYCSIKRFPAANLRRGTFLYSFVSFAKFAMIFLTPELRGPQTPSAETGSYAYGNATGSPLETHAPDGVRRFHRRAKGMRRAPRRVRLRVISNGGFAPKPPCGVCADVCCIAFDACERFRFCHGPAFAGPLEGSGGGCRREQPTLARPWGAAGEWLRS